MDEQLLAYFWGEDWKGEYPQWERYTDEQKADFTRLKALLATEYDRGYATGFNDGVYKGFDKGLKRRQDESGE